MSAFLESPNFRTTENKCKIDLADSGFRKENLNVNVEYRKKRIEFEAKLVDEMPALKVYSRKFTHDVDDSNDLIQETLVKALKFWDSFKEGTNFKGWLYTIMRNTFINFYRSKMMIRSEIEQVEDLTSAQLFTSSTRNLGESKIVIDDVKSALNTIRKDLYLPFTMYYNGHKYHEIAEYLSIPMGTVKNRIHLARKILKVILEPYHYFRSIAYPCS